MRRHLHLPLVLRHTSSVTAYYSLSTIFTWSLMSLSSIFAQILLIIGAFFRGALRQAFCGDGDRGTTRDKDRRLQSTSPNGPSLKDLP